MDDNQQNNADKSPERKQAVLHVPVILDFSHARRQLVDFQNELTGQVLHIPVHGDESQHAHHLLKSIFHHLSSIERSLTGPRGDQGIDMTPETQALIDQSKASRTVNDSALVAINGILGRIDTAVANAVAAGTLTPADAAIVTQETADLKSSSDALAAGIATDAAGQPTPNPAPVV